MSILTIRRAPGRRAAMMIAAWGVLAVPAVASAQQVVQAPAPATSELPQRVVSLTFSPIHLLLPVFEASLEVAPARQVGIAAIGGYGSVNAASIGGLTQSFGVYEIGGQLRYYVIGAFERGLHLGVEALYVHVQADNIVGSGVNGLGTALGIGPLVGYKLTTNGGFTFEAQGGVAIELLRAEASDTTDSANAKENTVAPILNLNVGWSF